MKSVGFQTIRDLILDSSPLKIGSFFFTNGSNKFEIFNFSSIAFS